MLDAKINRLDYGEQLIPPHHSYDLDFAVGTTYSLDLEAIMVLPVAMFYSRHLDCSPDDLHFDVLDAITQSAEKIRVYCQKGKIKVPRKYNYLMAYWEEGIAEVRMDSVFASFHPKVWVVRFTKKGLAPYYRILITSRNLTYAHDWDIAFASEGEVGSISIDKNTPLIQFLEYLHRKDGKPYPQGFLEDLAKVNFNLPEGYHLMNFHPIGIHVPENDMTFTNPLAKKSWEDLLVISPFVDKTTIRNLVEKTSGKLSMLSRKEELDKIDADLISDLGKNRVFQFSEFIKDGERFEGISEGSSLEVLSQNLHAKIFIGSKNNYSHWFMGSANCTQPAFSSRNIEFMVELKTDQGKRFPSKICKALTESPNGELSLFEPYQIDMRPSGPGDESLDSHLRKIIYKLTELVFLGELVSRTAGEHTLYDLSIQCDATSLSLPKDFDVGVRPLPELTALSKALVPGKVNLIQDFKGYNELQLSPYLVIEVGYQGTTIKSFIAEMQIDLPQSRMDHIFRSIINDKEKFLKYLSFLLGKTTPEPIQGDDKRPESIRQKGIATANTFSASLYENLLVAASRRPERLRSVEKIIQRLKDNNSDNSTIITEDFLRLWSVFENFLNREEK